LQQQQTGAWLFPEKDVAIIRALNPEAKAVACGNTG